MNSIKPTEYDFYYQIYIEKGYSKSSIVEGLLLNLDKMMSFYSSIPYEKHNYAYAMGKWTIKDILLHTIDTERIFAYRALRIARRDKTPMVGFEQDNYVSNGFANNRTMEDLLDEYQSMRHSTITLFQGFSSSALLEIGEASGCPFSVRALGYMIVGHENHHIQIIEERYL
ncbi:DinB family protein [Winogradskyella epiphytica]|uniref:DinB family protein n=2 Tax=Winogradskyella epiphytica TaxID=262005 RepID=A0A2V4WXI7_9FLAO|nr:DinB family protein [Winogradskyella epiphytica]PYE81722.1 DinB family protein [Winogradskyella epiphytica]GGW63135.1 DNA damage-inducible protein DinB [Winogradskyella epiphytica]